MTYALTMKALLVTSLTFALAACAGGARPGVHAASSPSCGSGPDDWCTSAADGPCGAHPNEKSCRANPSCKGKPYDGESVVACHEDGKGFWDNCPAVGCVSR